MAPKYILAISFFIGTASYFVASYTNEQWHNLILLIGMGLAGVLPIIKREDKGHNFWMGLMAGCLGVGAALLIVRYLL